jgi:hypothetical protein
MIDQGSTPMDNQVDAARRILLGTFSFGCVGRLRFEQTGSSTVRRHSVQHARLRSAQSFKRHLDASDRPAVALVDSVCAFLATWILPLQLVYATAGCQLKGQGTATETSGPIVDDLDSMSSGTPQQNRQNVM